MTLDRLQPSQRATVRNVTCAQPARSRLTDLGLIPGADIRLLRKAPFGSGFQIEVRSSCLMLRKDIANLIEVQVSQ